MARLQLGQAQARALVEVLSDHYGDAGIAAFEDAQDRWQFELHAAGPLDRKKLTALVADAAGARAARALTFTTVAAKDWVAASLADLTPVAAGRFLVHGSHDRARAKAALAPQS